MKRKMVDYKKYIKNKLYLCIYMNIFLNLYLFALNYSEKKSNNMEVNVELPTIKKIPAYMHKIKNKTGYDFRNSTIEQIDTNILQSIKKHETLLKLQSDNLSMFEKIMIIEELDKEKNYMSNIENGGLFDGWNNIF
jgi:hypothetical protein